MENELDSIVESREEFMVSPTANVNAKPILRSAHFLKPCLSLNHQGISELSSLSLHSLPPTFDPKNWPLTINFHGWRNPSKNWKEWVSKMASLHAPTWRKVGIYDAILNSTLQIHTNSDIILGVAERWCTDTNSFIFPWGEATVTLEDMLIAGYSVLGSPVFKPLETEESKAVQDALVRERKKTIQTPAKKACQATWLKVFMDSGSEIEHEAFLSLWLSRFVLPTSRDVIGECVFPIAIHLARGTRIALAPALLSTVYRDLSLLKQKIVSLTSLGADVHEKLVATTFAPFQLVLIWVWERFLKLSPNTKLLKIWEPRFAQWNNAKCNVKNVRSLLDASKVSFNWRPYTKPLHNWDFPKFYREEELRVFSDSDLDDDLLSFVMCLRVSVLVGLDSKCREQYLPHRVARQFGFDQDLPGFVVQSSDSSEDAWSRYIRPVGDVKCVIPSRLFENDDVTARYWDWLVTNVLKEINKEAARTKEDHILSNSADSDFITSKISISPPRILKSKPIVDHGNQPKTFAKSSKIKEEICEINNRPVPPGFLPPKRDRVQEEDYDSSEEDNLTIAKILKRKQKQDVSSIKQKDSSTKSNGQCHNSNKSSGTPIAAKTSAVVAAHVKTMFKSKDDCNIKPSQSRSYSCSYVHKLADNGEDVDHENVSAQLGEGKSHSSSVAAANGLEVQEERMAENVVVKEKEDIESANECVRASTADYENKDINGDSVEAVLMGLKCRIERIENIISARKASLKRS